MISLLTLFILCCSLIDGSRASFATESSSSALISPKNIRTTSRGSSAALAALENGDTTTQNNSQPSFTLKKRNPYDVHVYYNGSNQRETAMLLRSKMKQQFPWMRFYEPKDRPIGPHPLPMWEADFASYDNRVFWGEVCDFIKEEHDKLSILVHPHSLDGDYADHTKNAFWVGNVLELRIQGWKR